MLPCVPACRISAGNIEPGRIVQRAGVIADGDDLQPVLMQLQRRIRSDIAKALDHGGRGAWIDRQLLQHAPGEIGDAAPRCFAPAERAARRYRLAGDDLGHGAALVHRIGVHEPGHHLLIGAHVGRHHVGMRTDEGNHLLHVAPRQRFQLALGDGGEIDIDAALGAAIGQPDQRAFPAHPDRKGRDLADVDGGRESRAALGRAEGEVMLHPVAFEYRDRAVVAVNRTGNGDGPLRHQDSVALVHRDFEMVGDDAKLVNRHVEHRTGINGHHSLHFCRTAGKPGQPSAVIRPYTRALKTDGRSLLYTPISSCKDGTVANNFSECIR